MEVIDFLKLTHTADELAGNLSGRQKHSELEGLEWLMPKWYFLIKLARVLNETNYNMLVTPSDFYSDHILQLMA
jgi:hypothetical protein